MSGLDQIIERICVESESECSQILAAAQAECEAIQAEHEKQAAAMANDIKTAANDTLVKIRDSAKGQIAADQKKELLNAKQALVSELTAQALERVQNMPVEQYFDVLTKLLSRYRQNKSGEILLCKKDLENLTPAFQEALCEFQLKTVEEDEIHGGGFILRYGDIEENCSFPALFAEKEEAVRDKAYQILFG